MQKQKYEQQLEHKEAREEMQKQKYEQQVGTMTEAILSERPQNQRLKQEEMQKQENSSEQCVHLELQQPPQHALVCV
jgi:hypothetical protein